MEIQYVYSKQRSDFGKPCYFSDYFKIIDNYKPKRELMEEFIERDPVHRSTQVVKLWGHHEMNTTMTEVDIKGVNHTEGGWPKDINCFDIEQTMRYRKKIEKEENWVPVMQVLTQDMQKYILQNNAFDIYKSYFSLEDTDPLIPQATTRTANVYRDPMPVKRPVNDISWSPEGGTHIACAHCSLEFQRQPHELSLDSFVWDLENPNRPMLNLTPASPIVSIAYNPRDQNIIAGGLYHGQTQIWDIRRGSEPIDSTHVYYGHRDIVQKLIWIVSKTGTEFFTASSDGMVKWWDTRNLKDTTETLLLDINRNDVQELSKALGASALEYETTIPMKFMVGTENGLIINCNRKGKSHLDKIIGKYSAHIGPVMSLERNPGFVKNFLSIGGYTARIWSEDCRESSIMWTRNHKCQLTGGIWSPTKFPLYYVIKADGFLELWDILQKHKKPILSVKICDAPLKCINANEYGNIIATGNALGNVVLTEVSEILSTCEKNEKPLVTAMFEREAHREKILEARNREIKLKQKQRASKLDIEDISEEQKKEILIAELAQAEEEFFSIVEKEWNEFRKINIENIAEDLEEDEAEEEEMRAVGETIIDPITAVEDGQKARAEENK